MVRVAGAAGVAKTKLDNLDALSTLLPQSEVYNTLTLSPAAAAALEVKVTVNTLDVKLPESIVAFAPNVPVNDHTYPVAAPAVVDATGKAGAE
jgi:hypothetical protein